ncbi:hypothetical protein ACUH97_07955 [Dermabacteraceae bacterium P13088]
MAAAYELATAYVTLAVESSQIKRSIKETFKQSDRIASDSGKSMGKKMAQEFDKSGPDFSRLEAKAKTAADKVAASAKALSRTRADLARKVEIAEQKVIETRERSISTDRKVREAERALARARKDGDPVKVAKAEQVLARARDAVKPTAADLAAEDRLTLARQKYIDTSRRGIQQISAYRKEQEQANEKLRAARAAATDAATGADRAGGAFARLRERLAGVTRSKVKESLEGASRAAREAAKSIPRAAAGIPAAFGRTARAIPGQFKGALTRIRSDVARTAKALPRGFKSAGQKAGEAFSGSFGSLVKGRLGVLAGSLGALVGVQQTWQSFLDGADLEQSVGAVETVFRGNAKGLLKKSDNAALDLGISRNEYNELATLMGTQLKNSGVKNYAGKTHELIGRGADLSALYGGSTNEAVSAISSALKGERDPIEKYGVSLRQAAIDAKAAELGFKKVGGSFEQNAQAAATLALIYEQTKDAQGRFATESGTAANTLQKLTAKLKNMRAEAGQKIMPVLNTMGMWLLDTGIPAMEAMKDAVSGVWDILYKGDFTGGIFGLHEDDAFITFLFDLRKAAIAVWNDFLEPVAKWVAENGKPIMAFLAGFVATLAGSALITAAIAIGTTLAGALAAVAAAVFSIPVAIAALVGALTWFFTQTEIGQKIFAGLVDLISTAFGWIANTAVPAVVDAVSGLFSSLSEGFFAAYEAVTGFFAGIRDAIAGAASWIAEAASLLWAGLTMDSETRAEFDGQLDGLVAFGAGVRAVFDAVVGVAKGAFDALAAAATWLWQNVMIPVWNGIAAVMNVFVILAKLYIGYVVLVYRNIFAPVVMWLWQNIMKPAWEGISSLIAGAADFISSAGRSLSDFWANTLAPAVMSLWRDVMVPAWEGVKAAVAAAVSAVMSVGRSLVVFWNSTVAPAVMWLWRSVFAPVWDGIKAAVKAAVDGAVSALSTMVAFWRSVLAPVVSWLWRNVFAPAWAGIQAAIRVVVDWFNGTAMPLIRVAARAIGGAFSVLKGTTATVWNGIKSVIGGVWEKGIKPAFDALYHFTTTSIPNGFKAAKEGIEKWWSKIRSIAATPVKFVVNSVIYPLAQSFDSVADVLGMKKLNFKKVEFATGGVMPGYTPGRDVYDFIDPVRGVRLGLSGGEPIMRPEVGRALGHGTIHKINEIARTRGVSGVKKAFAFKSGGVFDGAKGIAGDTYDWLKKKAKSTISVVTNPVGALTSLVNSLLPGLPGVGPFVDGLRNLPRKIVQAIGNKFTSLFSGGDHLSPPPGNGPVLRSWQQIAAIPHPGLQITSTVRRGARTAASGVVSLHSLGKAVDFAGPPAAMKRFFTFVRNNYRVSELIHTPMGGAQLSRGGKPRAHFPAITERMHYNHVHVGGFAKGGVFNPPRLYDRGGVLRPGYTPVFNHTGKDEAVLTHDQWELIREFADAIGEQGDGQAGIGTLNINLSLDDLKNLADLEAFMRMLRVHARMQGGVTV